MAYYDWYHWFPNVSREGRPQDVLMKLNQEMAAKNLTVHYWQLDAYWYKLEIKPAYCVVDWHAVSDQFPNGLAWLSNQLNAPLMLYTDTWCKDNVHRKEKGGNFTFMDGDAVHMSWFDGIPANVIPEESLDFYRLIMRQGKSQGMGAFEVDFLDFNFKLYERFLSEPGAFSNWLLGMDMAAAEQGVSIQYCMALPQELLNTVSLKTVTSARVSGDGGRPYTGGGPGSLLLAALGVRPFQDNTWTSGAFPKAMADLASAVLSMGPVGLADQLGRTDAQLAAAACRRDGTLLQPSRPATPIDAFFLPNPPRGSVMSANSGPRSGGLEWHIVMATGVDPAFRMLPDDLYPPPAAGARLISWLRGGSCAIGQAVTGCISEFSQTSGLAPEASAKSAELYHIAPVAASGWVLLGEASKIVPVAAARFQSVEYTSSGIAASIVGSAGETVELLFAGMDTSQGQGLIQGRTLTLPASGRASVTMGLLEQYV